MIGLLPVYPLAVGLAVAGAGGDKALLWGVSNQAMCIVRSIVLHGEYTLLYGEHTLLHW